MARQVAAQIEDGETLFLGQGSILRKVIPFWPTEKSFACC
jgi:DeoR/GlpR family transcriptional regulator of sugar metabolism